MDFLIRLTKLSDEKNEQLSYDLKKFTVDLSDQSIIHHGCFEYAERIEVINVCNLELKSNGAYVIKVLVKTSEKEKYNVQMIHPLYIK